MRRAVARGISLVSIIAGLLANCTTLWGDTKNGSRPFTVSDAIELSTFVNYSVTGDSFVSAAPIISPDQKYFLMVTKRGRVATNRIESTIWLFNRQAVVDYVLRKSSLKPAPRPIASMSASSNLPIISGVRWLNDSKRIAFLGKNGGAYQQLFIVGVNTGHIIAITKHDMYVSTFDISGDTIAYTTLTLGAQADDRDPALLDVAGHSIDSLLYPKVTQIDDNLQWGDFISNGAALHIMRNGKNVPLSFSLKGRSLRLFAPVWSMAPPLSLSPDGNFLITLAPVNEIPPGWDVYEPGNKYEFARLRPGDKRAVSEENEFKALQFVLIDLRTGHASPLVDAPVGRSLVYTQPVKVIWLDRVRAVLCNTFLPLDSAQDETDVMQRKTGPFVALVNIDTHDIQPITPLRDTPMESEHGRRLVDLSRNAAGNEISLSYAGTGADENSGIQFSETYTFRSRHWIKIETPTVVPSSVSPETEVWVEEAFDQSPVLSGRHRNDPVSIVWDPNPQLAAVALGKVSLYHWKDKNGSLWSGLLALPPDYDSSRRYPLVIQTHGYDLKKYFADGMYTTGSPGRALTAKEIVVLQMDMPMKNFRTPMDGPFQMGGFEAAIEQLKSDGLIDPRRVGVIAFSFTCFHTLYTLTHDPDLFAAATINDGNNMSYSQYIFDDTGGGFQDISDQTNGGSPWGQNLLAWASSAPDFNLDKIHAPVLISALERGQLLRQWEPYAGLRRLGKPVDMLWLRHEDASHILVKPTHRYLSQGSAVDWFEFWLNGHEDPNPIKVEQYRRWRELRKLREETDTKNKAAKEKAAETAH